MEFMFSIHSSYVVAVLCVPDDIHTM